MFLVPAVISSKLDPSSNLLVTADLKLVQVRKMSFGANMGQKVRDITEARLLGADGAFQQN